MKKVKMIAGALAAALIIIAAIVIIATVAFESEGTNRVVIDAGHGGSDVGAEYNGRYEKDDNLALALLVEEKLRELGVDVYLTRDDDTFVSLEERCKFANGKRADLFVSLHRNSAQGAQGVEIWVERTGSSDGSKLAKNILDNLEDVGISENRGVKKGYAQGFGDYYINSHTEMPSCLVELGFINSETDNELYDKYLDEYADAIARAIIESLDVEVSE